MSKISVTTIAGLTSGGDANTVKIESGDDFVVDTNVLKVDATNNRVGIGLTAPEQSLHVRNSSGNSVAILGQYGTGTKASLTAAANQVELKAHNGTNDIITFATGSTERVRIQSAGGISFNGDTATANALDDYEEGTWTPSLGGNTTYSSQLGKYTKVGRLVHADFDFTVNALGTGSASTLTGFPFPMGNYGGVMSGYCSYYTGLAVTVTYLSCYIISNTSNMYFTGHNVGAAANIGNALSVFQNSTRVLGSVAYYVAQ